VTPALDGFTYYPFLGLPSPGMSPMGAYSPYPYLPRQLGFSSIYLPGYTYRPLFLGTVGVGPIGHRFPTYPLSHPRVGGGPGAGYVTPLPRTPVARPGMTHGTPAVGVHVGAHR
jgi:hypothetical protein